MLFADDIIYPNIIFVAPDKFIGETALSVDSAITFSILFSKATSIKFCVPIILFLQIHRDHTQRQALVLKLLHVLLSLTTIALYSDSLLYLQEKPIFEYFFQTKILSYFVSIHLLKNYSF